MADQQTKLSIVIRTVDQATAKIKAINERLDAATRPTREFGKALSDLKDKSGLNDVIGGFKGVGDAVAGILSKLAMVGGLIGAATAGLLALVGEFDDLGDKAEAIGVSVDFLAQMRYAAQKSGASVEQLDAGLQNFTKALGQARAGTGRMAAFLTKIEGPLLAQVKAAKTSEEAFNLMAGAMAKLEDPAKRAALASAAFGDAALAPLLYRGADGVKALRDRYTELAPGMKGAVDAAGKVDDSMVDLKASTDGIKAALVSGLAPALKGIVEQLTAFFAENRAAIAEWAKDLGKRLPGAVAKAIEIFKSVVDSIRPFVDAGWKLKALAIALAGVIVGPLVSALVTLGKAALTNPIMLLVTAIAAGAYLIVKNWDSITAFFGALWDGIKAVFSAFFGWVKDLFLKYTPLGMIVENWSAITDFFSGLWDGVIGVFQHAWDFIMGIVDKIVGAVDSVKNAASDVIDFLNPFSDGPDGAPMQDAVNKMITDIQAGQFQAQQANIRVDFANAPMGMRTFADPQNTATVDFSVGYQMGGFGP